MPLQLKNIFRLEKINMGFDREKVELLYFTAFGQEDCHPGDSPSFSKHLLFYIVFPLQGLLHFEEQSLSHSNYSPFVN